MTIEWIKLGLSVLNFVGLILGFFYVRLERKDTATNKSIEELRSYADKRFDDKCTRISRLEIEVSRIPTRDEFDKSQRRMEEQVKLVYDRINEINKSNQDANRDINLSLGTIIGQLKGLSGDKHG
jgi:hypothetical protein